MDKMHKAKAMNYINMYNKENYVNISIRVKPEVKQEIVNNAETRKMSLASFIVKSCKYIIDNNIQFKEQHYILWIFDNSKVQYYNMY